MRPRWTIKTPLPVGQWRQVSEKADFGSRLAKNNFMSAKKFPAASLPFIFQSVVPFVTSVCRTKNYDTSTLLLFPTTTKHNLCVGIGRSLGIGWNGLEFGSWMLDANLANGHISRQANMTAAMSSTWLLSAAVLLLCSVAEFHVEKALPANVKIILIKALPAKGFP